MKKKDKRKLWEVEQDRDDPDKILEEGKPLGECKTKKEFWEAERRIMRWYWETEKDYLIKLDGEKKALREHYERLRKIDEEYGLSEYAGVRPRNTMYR